MPDEKIKESEPNSRHVNQKYTDHRMHDKNFDRSENFDDIIDDRDNDENNDYENGDEDQVQHYWNEVEHEDEMDENPERRR